MRGELLRVLTSGFFALKNRHHGSFDSLYFFSPEKSARLSLLKEVEHSVSQSQKDKTPKIFYM